MASSVIGNLRVNLGLDSGSFQRGMNNANKTISSIQKKFDTFGEAAQKAGQAFSRISIGIGAVAGSAGLLVTSTATAGAEISKQAQLANASTTEFQRLAAAAKSVGVENDKLSDILKDTNDRVGDFLSTGGGEMADFFTNVAPKVGVTAEMFRGLSGPDALQLYVSTLHRAGLNQQELTFYMESLADEATALAPLFADNGRELNRLADAAENAGGIMSEGALAASKAFKDQMNLLQIALQGARTSIAVELLPAATQLATWITTNGVPALQQLGQYLGQAIEWFQGLPEPVQRAAAAITVAFAVGGPVLIALGAAAIAIGALSAPVVLVGAAIGVLTGAVVAFWPELVRATEAVVNFAAALQEKINGLASDIVGIFAGIRDKMVDIGAQILDGLWQGLGDKYREVSERFYGMVGGLVDGVKERLGIHSPSRVFAEIGQFIMQGLGLGIRENAGEATNAMSEVTDQVAGSGGQVGSLADSFDLIGTSANAAFQNILTRAKTVKEALRGIAESVVNSLSNRFISNGTNMLFSALGIPGNANGTSNFAGGWTQIHERGEELAYLPSGSQIIPAGLSKQMAKQDKGGSRFSVEAVPNPYFDVRVNEISGTNDARMSRAQAKAAPRLNADNARRRINA